jgi:polyhydroxyalkanoate synthesis regulator phasin
MADDKKKASKRASERAGDRVTDKAGEIAKNIWLAGVGAYGRAVDEAQGRLEKAGVEPPKLFRDLVKAGAALEEEAREAIEAGQAARLSVEDRINRVRDNFNMQLPARGEDLLALHEKIDRLSNRVDELTEALAASAPARKPAAKKTTRKKAPAKKKKAAAKSRPAAPGRTAAKRKTTATGTAARRRKATPRK